MSPETALNRKAFERWIAQYISAVIDTPPEKISRTDTFTDIGFDSAEVVIMTGVMEEEFAIQVDAHLPFEHPSISALIEALAERGIVEK